MNIFSEALTENYACFVVHLLTNFSLEIWVGSLLCEGGSAVPLSRKPEYVQCTAPCYCASFCSCEFPALLWENISLFHFPLALQLFGMLDLWNSVRGMCAHKNLLAGYGKCGTNWQPKGSLFFLFTFFPSPCALYDKENSACWARGLEATLAKMKTGLTQQGYCSLALPWQCSGYCFTKVVYLYICSSFNRQDLLQQSPTQSRSAVDFVGWGGPTDYVMCSWELSAGTFVLISCWVQIH